MSLLRTAVISSASKVESGDGSSPSVPHHKEAIRNCALSMDQIQDYRCPMSPVSEAPLSPAYSTITRHKSPAVGRVVGIVPSSPVTRRSSEPQLCPSSNNNVPCPEILPSTHSTPAHGYSQPPGPTLPVPLPAKSYVERLQVEEAGRWPRGESVEESFTVPMVETASAFQPNAYPSLLMPAENKPLEMGVLKRVKELLAEVDAKTTAMHLTQADCTVARILGVTKEMQRMMGVSSGLELLTLPHGRQLRLDLLERFHTMSIMMAVDLLGCTGSTEERAALLHKTIQLAAELKSNLGNMFGFAAVMKALELPQVRRSRCHESETVQLGICYEIVFHMLQMYDMIAHVLFVLTPVMRYVHGRICIMLAYLVNLSRTTWRPRGFQARAEVLEVFCTEFQMRLLWGSRGAEGSQGERYEKFDKVLTALSNKLEPPKELKAWVEGNLTACARSVFVFDEMDKMPPGLIDVLVPFLGSSHVVYQTNYRKAIYVFISTAGEEQINRLALEARRAGRDREEIRLEELEDAIAQAVFNKSCNGFYHSEIIQEKLVDCFVPFLPLTRRHVERCVRRELCLRGQCHRHDIIEAITGAMTFSPERERLFSHSGCKTVPSKVNYYL
ncbi:UNVERIFIED_CONTAM: hypothetical protein FKN15_062358 [Acipenser sinensis]